MFQFIDEDEDRIGRPNEGVGVDVSKKVISNQR